MSDKSISDFLKNLALCSKIEYQLKQKETELEKLRQELDIVLD